MSYRIRAEAVGLALGLLLIACNPGGSECAQNQQGGRCEEPISLPKEIIGEYSFISSEVNYENGLKLKFDGSTTQVDYQILKNGTTLQTWIHSGETTRYNGRFLKVDPISATEWKAAIEYELATDTTVFELRKDTLIVTTKYPPVGTVKPGMTEIDVLKKR